MTREFTKTTKALAKAVRNVAIDSMEDATDFMTNLGFDHRMNVLEYLLFAEKPVKVPTLEFVYDPKYDYDPSYPYGQRPVTEKIRAIKAVRAFTGYGLKEAKDFVESVGESVRSHEIKAGSLDWQGRPITYTWSQFALDLVGTGYKLREVPSV